MAGETITRMTALTTISTKALLRVWSELEQCYYGDNGYGSDTAEIYAFRLMPNLPTQGWDSVFAHESLREAQVDAGNALADICEMFERERGVTVTINGLSVAEWNSDGDEPFVHRAHVQVVHPERDTATKGGGERSDGMTITNTRQYLEARKTALNAQLAEVKDEIDELEWRKDSIEDDLYEIEQKLESILAQRTPEEVEAEECEAKMAFLLKQRYGHERPSVSIADWWTR